METIKKRFYIRLNVYCVEEHRDLAYWQKGDRVESSLTEGESLREEWHTRDIGHKSNVILEEAERGWDNWNENGCLISIES